MSDPTGRASGATERGELQGHAYRWDPPADAGDALPTLLLLHGTGGTEDDLVPLAREVSPGAGLLGVRGRVLENGMPRFFRRFGEGRLDVDDLKARALELADFTAAAAERHGFDPARVVALGFSNGANVAAGMLLERPGALAGAALVRAMVPYEPAAAGPIGEPEVLVLSGRNDPIVPAGHPERLAAILEARGARVRLRWQPAAHGLTPGDVQELRAWLPLLGGVGG